MVSAPFSAFFFQNQNHSLSRLCSRTLTSPVAENELIGVRMCLIVLGLQSCVTSSDVLYRSQHTHTYDLLFLSKKSKSWLYVRVLLLSKQKLITQSMCACRTASHSLTLRMSCVN
jgi:hypothetical protein